MLLCVALCVCSRALLLRGEAIHRLESRITELLQVRAIDVREKVQDLRALEGGSGGGVSEALRNKWNEGQSASHSALAPYTPRPLSRPAPHAMG